MNNINGGYAPGANGTMGERTSTSWVGLNVGQLVPAQVAQIPAIVNPIIVAVDAAMEVVALLATVLDEMAAILEDPKIAALRIALDVVKQQLIQFIGHSHGLGIHFLSVPIVQTDNPAL